MPSVPAMALAVLASFYDKDRLAMLKRRIDVLVISLMHRIGCKSIKFL